MARKKEEINPIRGERLQTIIEENGYSQKALAGVLHVSTVHLNNVVKGRKNLTADLAAEIINLFPKYELNWLLGYSEFKTVNARVNSIIKKKSTQLSLVEELIWEHGYSIDDSLSGKLCIIAPNNSSAFYLTSNEFMNLLRSVDNYLIGQLLLLEKRSEKEEK